MVILDEKYMQPVPPPPYVAAGAVAPPPFSANRPHRAGFSALPPHLLLKIVYMTFPQTPSVDQGLSERQRKTLYWMSLRLRLVNRSFYIACMHVLRSTYLSAYQSCVRAPYTSDPFPLSSSGTPMDSPLGTIQRETRVFDLFIALKVREDVMMDESELHLEREESFKDLFDLMQPRSRLEDLIRDSVPASIPFSSLSISLFPKKVGLVLTSKGRKRTVVEVTRNKDETLEATAVKLKKWLKNQTIGTI